MPPVPRLQLRGGVRQARRGVRLHGPRRVAHGGLHLVRLHSPGVEESWHRQVHALPPVPGETREPMNGLQACNTSLL